MKYRNIPHQTTAAVGNVVLCYVYYTKEFPICLLVILYEIRRCILCNSTENRSFIPLLWVKTGYKGRNFLEERFPRSETQLYEGAGQINNLRK